ncbi:arsC family protein [Brucella rhizosphaerae]|uniref:Arsenate reductase n=2 Tax=Brucella rhizosphaerae TaxID=571254 RepID=A0A256FBR7_9HYPH|nr:arsC family protein [Brucella rhizosphaerae]
MIRASGEEPVVIEYVQNPPSRARLVELLAAMQMAPRQLLREKGTPYAELELSNPNWTDSELINFMIASPILINRPIVETTLGTRLCRPSELVLEILENPASLFTKEDGKQITYERGSR